MESGLCDGDMESGLCDGDIKRIGQIVSDSDGERTSPGGGHTGEASRAKSTHSLHSLKGGGSISSKMR